MLIVLADDFSGAAEMGGIAHRYGLSAEVHLDTDLQCDAKVLVIDADTRSMSRADAVAKTLRLADAIKRSTHSGLFKKVDSVLRGHIAPESEVLKEWLGYKRVLLLPANPRKGRTIRDGHYYIDGVSLLDTIFRGDPDFPASSSSIKNLVKTEGTKLLHTHIRPKDELPSAGLITGDTETKSDIIGYLAQSDKNDLCCGGAECFEAYLEHLGYSVKPAPNINPSNKGFALFLNGSTVKSRDEDELFTRSAVAFRPLPGKWVHEEFVLKREMATAWHEDILALLHGQSIVSVTIDLPVKQVRNASSIFLPHFVALMHYLSSKININDVHVALTGGATASTVIRDSGEKRLTVETEIAPGVVTLAGHGKHNRFTVKPGSYHWPGSFLELLNEK